MKENRVGRRLKPAVAFTNAARAAKNIEAKIDTIKTLLSSGAVLIESNSCILKPNLALRLPQSIRQFNQWESGHTDDPSDLGVSFSRNSNQTLKAHPILFEAAVDCIAAVKASLKEANSKKPTSDDRTAALKRKISLANALRDIAESEIISLKFKIAQLEDEIKRLKHTNQQLNTRLLNTKPLSK